MSPVSICQRCWGLDDPERGRRCICHTSYDPVEVRQRHESAVWLARASAAAAARARIVERPAA